MTTKLKIWNIAARRLGLGRIASDVDQTPHALAFADLWDDLRLACLSMHPWRFTVTKGGPFTLTAGAWGEWAYRQNMATMFPGTLLTGTGPLAVFSSGGIDAPPLKAWDFFASQLYANVSPVWVDAQKDVPESDWPGPFAQFVAAALAADACVTTTGNERLAVQLRAEAYGPPADNMQGGLLGVAKRTLARSRPSPSLLDDGGPLIAARFS